MNETSADENLAGTITKLAVTSKDADNILKKVKVIFRDYYRQCSV